MRLAFFGFLGGGLIVAACGSNDIEGSRLDNADQDATSSLFALGVGSDGCGVAIPNLDDTFLDALPDCTGGLAGGSASGADGGAPKNVAGGGLPKGEGGKCVPESPLTPPEVTKLLGKCEGTTATCIPLSFIRANKEPLKSCTSYGKTPGVCVSRIIPTIDKLTFLPKDTCRESERCAPCANPLDQKPTGICDIGKPAKKPADQCKKDPAPVACPYKGPPVLDIKKLTACAPEGMHCLPKAIVPEAFAAQLTPCADPNFLCAPDKSIEANGQFIPKTCASVGGAEGRCLHEKIPQVTAQAKFLPSTGCESYERCVPCFDPLSGAKLPTCAISCDPGPTKPPFIFTKCQDDRGRCVPKTAVPAAMQKNLKATDCKEGEELCAPTIAIDRDAKPQKCLLKYIGISRPASPAVCVEDVLTIGTLLSQSDCPEKFKCTPCINPVNDEPTGLPGCPATAP